MKSKKMWGILLFACLFVIYGVRANAAEGEVPVADVGNATAEAPAVISNEPVAESPAIVMSAPVPEAPTAPEPVPAPETPSAPEPVPVPETPSAPEPVPVPETPSAPESTPEPPSGSVPVTPTAPVVETPKDTNIESSASGNETQGTNTGSPVSINENKGTKTDVIAPAAATTTTTDSNKQTTTIVTTTDSSPGSQDIKTSVDIPTGSVSIESHKKNTAESLTTPISFSNGTTTVKKEGNITKTTTVLESALKKAVEKALLDVTSDSDSIVVKVAPGIYTGNITVNQGMLRTGVQLKDGFLLYLLAGDAYDVDNQGNVIRMHEGGAGEATVDGNLTIDGMNVMLAGLYLSLNHTITTKNAVVEIYGSKKDDSVTLVLEDGSQVNVRTGEGTDALTIKGGSGTQADSNKAVIDMGTGSDTVSLDLSAANVLRTISIHGREGMDHIQFTGSLKKGTMPTVISSGSTSRFHMTNSGGKEMDIVAEQVENYSDTLTNKTTTTLKYEDIRTGAYHFTGSFVDYLLDTDAISKTAEIPNPSIVNLIITGSGFLTNLYVKNKGTLTIQKLIALGMNLILQAKNIVVKGELSGKNITMEAADDDTTFVVDTSSAVTEALKIPDSDMSFNVSICDSKNGSKIIVEEGAKIKAEESLTMSAVTNQTNPMIPVLSGANVVSVKIAETAIAIMGNITAKGNVKATASSVITMTASNAILAAAFVPIAVSIALSNCYVKLGKMGSIQAGGSVTLFGSSIITATSDATTGKVPISLAVAAVINDVLVEVAGDIQSQGDITIDAVGKTTVTTKARKAGGPGGSLIGGFFAVSVVLQDVTARVIEASNLQAAGDIRIHSTAEEKVATSATSSTPSAATDAVGTAPSITSITGSVTSILKFAATKLGGSAVDKIKTLIGHVDGTDGYEVTCEAAENGTITAPAKVKAGENAKIQVTPKEGYQIGALTFTYLPKGEKAYRTMNISTAAGGTSFTFLMPDAKVTIKAIFTKKTTPGGQDEDLGDLFGEDEEGNDGLEDLYNKGVSGTDDTDTSNRAVDGSTGAYTITTSDYSGGALVPNVKSADAGKEVLIIINPVNGYQLKANTLMAQVALEGRTTTMNILANSKGEYLLTMPKGNVTLKVEFEKITAAGQTSTPSTPSSSQVTGALAVTFSKNNNKAYIDTTGTIQAGGQVDLRGDALTQATTLADASPVGSAAAEVSKDTSKPDAARDNLVTFAQRKGIVTVEPTQNGTITITSNTIPGPADYPDTNTSTRVAFSISPRTGYALVEGSVHAVLTYDGKTVELQVNKDSRENYYFTIAHPEGQVLGEDAVVSLSALFEVILNSITIQIEEANAHGTVTTSAKTARPGDEIILDVKPEAGYQPTIKVGSKLLTPNADGKYVYTMPEGALVITASFLEKGYELKVDETVAGAGNYVKLSDTKANAGDTVRVTLSEAGVAQGKNLASVKAVIIYTDMYGEEQPIEEKDYITVKEDGTFLVPDAITGTKGFIRIIPVFADKKYAVEVDASILNGKVSTAARADALDTLTFKITPNTGYRIKENSLKVSTVNGSISAIITVEKDKNGIYTYRLPILTDPAATIKVTAVFIKDPNAASASTPGGSISLGVGVAVAVTKHSNSVYIKNGTIRSNGLSIVAASGSENALVTSQATAKAGYSAGAIGVGGAIAVHVASSKTKAVLGSHVIYEPMSADKDITVKAVSYDRFLTAAEGASTELGVIGVGAGIAVAVTGVDVTAAIEKNTTIKSSEQMPVGSLTVEASHTGSESVSAKAGSAGGISVAPALQVVVSGVNAQASVGTSAKPIYGSGTFTISASNVMDRQLAANAAAAGAAVGVGGAFGISIINDSARASLRRSVKGLHSAKVNAVSKSTLKSTVRAGAAGAVSNGGKESQTPSSGGSSGSDSEGDSGTGESDRQADKGIASGVQLSRNVNSKNVNSSATESQTKNRQKAQTTEGSIQVAAAFNLNIQSNRSEACVTDGIEITADEQVAVTAKNETDARIYANASATHALIGVGVAVAINVVDYNNLAYVGTAAITAGELLVTALMVEAPPKTTPADPNKKNILTELITQALNEMLDELFEEMGLGTIFGSDSALGEFRADLINDLIYDVSTTLLSGTGLENLLSVNIEEKIEKCVNNLSENLKAALTKEILALVAEKIKAAAESITGDKPMTGFEPQTLSTELQKIAENVAGYVFSDILNVSQLKAFFQGNIADTLRRKATEVLKSVGRSLTTNALSALSQWAGLKIEVQDMGPAHDIITQAIAGAGASLVGVAGSAAIAVIHGNTRAYLESVENQAQYPILIAGDTIIKAESTQNEDTTATSAVTSSGAADKNLAAGSDSDAGSGQIPGYESQTNKKITIGSTSHGKLTMDQGSQNTGATVTLTVTPDEGYLLDHITIRWKCRKRDYRKS